ncbi:MAG: phosphoenolpyruvate carboxykinase (ATP) [bacterium]
MKLLQELKNRYGIQNVGYIFRNVSPTYLVETAIRRGEGFLAANGALCVRTGQRTGRSPQDRYIVEGSSYHDKIDWGKRNVVLSKEAKAKIHKAVQVYLQNHDLFIFDGYAGAKKSQRIPLRVISVNAWHALFSHHLFIRPNPEDLESYQPEWTIINCANMEAPSLKELNSKVAVVVDLSEKLVYIIGTSYGGETKKIMFTICNLLLPERNVLSMHCSANVGSGGDVAILFGLSGTGKTSLGTDPQRRLIGDDEHGWDEEGIFNLEGGLYPKYIRLQQESEPMIWNSTVFGSILENVIVDEQTRTPDYNDGSITENTRGAFPIYYVEGAIQDGLGGHPRNIFFLTCDAYGVLPPISRLNEGQAQYQFISGYTAKVAGTEVGIEEPQADFSQCFGAPFLPLPPSVYAEMLGARIARYNPKVWLVNTGWTGGPYGIGSRIKIAYSRAMINAALRGDLDQVGYVLDPVFNVSVPQSCPDIPQNLLDPKSTWSDKQAYDQQARSLAQKFQKNFSRFSGVDHLVQYGPKG